MVKKQVIILLVIVLVFASFNFSIYQLLTQRLANNFSSATQAQMIDVKSYLPFDSHSDLVNINSSLKLNDELPVLDGAAALLPVYASIVHNVYPEGCVTYDGGVFSDDNYYGENFVIMLFSFSVTSFAKDSAMQYKNTVRGYKAIVDGETDLLFCAAPSQAQKQYALDQGVELEYVPIGLEGFVFFVNEAARSREPARGARPPAKGSEAGC